MAKRGPTLYELMGESGRLRGLGPSPNDPAHEAGPHEAPGLIQRTTLRVPLGYVLVAVAGVAAAVLLAYSIGYQAGQNRRDRMDAQRLAGQADRQAPTRDPLLAPSAGPATAAPTAEPDDTGPSDPAPARAATDGDPRTPGLNYFIVALYPEDLARRAAAFLRERGVDAAVVPNNASRNLYHVVSLRGFPRREVGTPAYTEHRALLMRLGRVWKREHDGPTDFSDAWAARYDPPGGVTAAAPD